MLDSCVLTPPYCHYRDDPTSGEILVRNKSKAGSRPGAKEPRQRARSGYLSWGPEAAERSYALIPNRQRSTLSRVYRLIANWHRVRMNAPLSLIVVEDDPQMRDRFARIFDQSDRVAVKAWAATAREGIEALDAVRPHVLLVDLGLPDASGISVIAHGHSCHPDCDIMVVSVYGDERSVLASIEAGATGYLLKDDSETDFVSRILELHAGGSPITPIIARRILQRFQGVGTQSGGDASALASLLSTREREALNLLARGFTYQEIATMLEVSPHTLGTYVKRLYQKLQVHSRGEAVFEGQRLGLL